MSAHLYLPNGQKHQVGALSDDRMRQQLQVQLYNYVYKHICKGESNDAIRDAMSKDRFPAMDDLTIQALRDYFTESEKRFPEKMAAIRAKLLK